MDIPKITLPPVRDLFIPDPGFTLFDVDLSGADAQVVAWEAEDEELKNAFRRGIKIHSFNAVTLEPAFGPYERFEAERKFNGKFETFYYDVKRAVHATNYGIRPRSLAQALGWSVSRATNFQTQWFTLRPGVHDWHRRTEFNIQTTRTVYNRFGYRRVYFDRPDAVLPQALAWVPQSTVGLVCARGDQLATEYFNKHPGTGGVLLQVHDSLVGQARTSRFAKIMGDLHGLLHSVIVPYSDPLCIPWGLAISERSWGEAVKVKWEDL